jgi:hypothetical protein
MNIATIFVPRIDALTFRQLAKKPVSIDEKNTYCQGNPRSSGLSGYLSGYLSGFRSGFRPGFRSGFRPGFRSGLRSG